MARSLTMFLDGLVLVSYIVGIVFTGAYQKNVIMGDRYDISVDIGGGKDSWYVYGLTAHDKVYECDLEIDIERWDKIGKEWNSKKKEIVESIFGNITIEKSNIMEEKKTKKMTKAEAFEYLMGKKVHVSGKVISDDVLTRLFACGVEWCNGGTDICYYSDYLIISPLGRLTHCGGTDLHYWERHGYEEISADDILSIEIVEEKNELEFNYDKAVELAKPLMHYLDEIGCGDSIRVSQFGIVHEPMSTLIFDNGIGE